MKTFLYATVYFLFIIQCHGQILDTSVFNSNFEKDLFLQISDSVIVDPADLFIAFESMGNQDQKKDRIESFNTSIQSLLAGKSNKSKIKSIYKKTHAAFFTKYDDKAFFNDIFKDGRYNCVTASALYSIMLQKNSIDILIKETPSHVYVIADPKSNQVLIETTMPIKGTFYYDDRYKRNYVEYLKDNKIISGNDYSTKSINELFSEHFDDNESINIQQLAALQYYNKGVFLYDNSEYENAAKNFEKAYFLYQSKKIQLAFHHTILSLFNEHSSTKAFSGKTLANFININEDNTPAHAIAVNYFKMMANEYAINKPQLDKYRQFYSEFNQFVNDSIDISDIEMNYHSFLGFTYFAKREFAESIQAFNKAYKLNGDNLLIRQHIEEAVTAHIIKDINRERELDSLKSYLAVFPFLTGNDRIMNAFTFYYLSIIGESISYEDTNKAFAYLNEFEELMSQFPDLALNKQYVEVAYIPLSIHFVQKQNYDKAEYYLEKGLELAPESYEIKDRLNTIKEAKESYKNYAPISNYKIIEIPEESSEQTTFKDRIEAYLPGKWEAVEYIENGKTTKIPSNEKLIINAHSNKKLEITDASYKENGRWAIRSKGKLLYWVYSDDDYEVFKVLELNEQVMRLQVYEGQQLEPEIVVFKAIKG